MILAAGRGERLRPITDRIPKPLVEAGGRPLIVHHLEKLRSCGISDIVINTAWLGEKLEEYLGNGESFGVNISWSRELPGGLETAGGLRHALHLLGTEPFLTTDRHYTFSGAAVYDPAAILEIPDERQPLKPWFEKWIGERKVSGELLQGRWFDVGTVQRLREVDEYAAGRIGGQN